MHGWLMSEASMRARTTGRAENGAGQSTKDPVFICNEDGMPIQGGYASTLEHGRGDRGQGPTAGHQHLRVV